MHLCIRLKGLQLAMHHYMTVQIVLCALYIHCEYKAISAITFKKKRTNKHTVYSKEWMRYYRFHSSVEWRTVVLYQVLHSQAIWHFSISYSTYSVLLWLHFAYIFSYWAQMIKSLADGMKCSPNGFKYLGVFIKPSIEINYSALLQNTKSNFNKLNNLPVSHIGWITLTEMSSFPTYIWHFFWEF